MHKAGLKCAAQKKCILQYKKNAFSQSKSLLEDNLDTWLWVLKAFHSADGITKEKTLALITTSHTSDIKGT